MSSEEFPGNQFNDLSSIGEAEIKIVTSSSEEASSSQSEKETTETTKKSKSQKKSRKTKRALNTTTTTSHSSTYSIWNTLTTKLAGTKRPRHADTSSLRNDTQSGYTKSQQSDSHSNLSSLHDDEQTMRKRARDDSRREEIQNDFTIPDENRLPPDRDECSLLSGLTSTCKAKRENKFSKLLKQGKQLATWLDAECVSTSFSKSHQESSLRFNCQNGHNFFLSINKVTETYQILLGSNA